MKNSFEGRLIWRPESGQMGLQQLKMHTSEICGVEKDGDQIEAHLLYFWYLNSLINKNVSLISILVWKSK